MSISSLQTKIEAPLVVFVLFVAQLAGFAPQDHSIWRARFNNPRHFLSSRDREGQKKKKKWRRDTAALMIKIGISTHTRRRKKKRDFFSSSSSWFSSLYFLCIVICRPCGLFFFLASPIGRVGGQ